MIKRTPNSHIRLLQNLRRKSPVTAAFALLLSMAQVQAGLAAITNDAVATGNYNGAAVTSAPSSVAIPVAGSTPSIVVIKTGALNDDDGVPGISVGDTISFEITVENDGNVSVDGTSLTDTISQNGTTLALTSGPTLTGGDTANAGVLDVGETWIYAASYTLTAANITDGNDVDNSAEFSGIGSGVPVSGTGTVNIPLDIDLAIELSKTADSSTLSSPPMVGDTISYQIIVENTGNVTVNDIAVSDPTADAGSITYTGGADGDSDNDIDSLSPGATALVIATHTLTQADIDAGSVVNQATGSGIGPGGTPVSDISDDADDSDGNTVDDPTVTPLPIVSALTLTKTATVTSFSVPGDTLSWDISVTNSGNTTVTAMTISDPIADTLVCPVSGNATIATLLPGDTETCVATYSVTAADVDTGVVDNTATVDGTAPNGPVTADDTATVSANPADLVTVKTLTSGTRNPAAGDIVGYQITVTNNGSADATGVTLTDQLPSGLTPTGANGTVSQGTYDAGSGLWTIGTISNGSSATLTLEGTLDAGITTPIVNITTVADGNENDPTDTGNILEVEITPRVRPIDAVDDTRPDPLDSAVPLSGVLNVFDNDTLDTIAVDPALVTLNTVGTVPTGFTLNPDGTVDVAQYTAPGTYSFDYEICEITDPTNCDTATVTIDIILSLPSISGTVFLDNNSDGIYNAGDSPQGGYIVRLMQGGVVLADTVTDASGDYIFEGFDPGTYGIIFIDPSNGIGVGIIQDIVVDRDDVIIDQDLPIDPSGVIYDSVAGTAISGATVRITDNAGSPLPAACVLPGQQPQVTGADGSFRFDIWTGAGAQCPAGRTTYRLEITPPTGYLPPPSINIPPSPGSLDPTICAEDVVPGGSCALHTVNAPPPISSPSPYYLAFDIAAGDPDIVRNHVPLDPIPAATAGSITLTKTAHVAVARRGDLVIYTLTARNNETFNLNVLELIDTLPVGFGYVPGSVTLDGVAIVPAVAGRTLTFAPVDIPAGGTATVHFSTRIGASVLPGLHTNTALVRDSGGVPISNQAIATIRVQAEHVFDCGEIIGKVFEDRNGNGYQDEGELGLPGVRVVTVKGLLITADAQGRYSVPCAALPDPEIGSNFILKLDTRTLPAGYRVTTENPRVVRLTRGKVTKLNFGAAQGRVVRIEIGGQAFGAGKSDPSQALVRGLRRLFGAKGKDASKLELVYRREEEAPELVHQRLQIIRRLIQKEWSNAGESAPLPIDFTIVGSTR